VDGYDEIYLPTMSPDGSRIAFTEGDGAYVVEVSTGTSSKVANGWAKATWIGNDTLIVSPG
jgi:hypothetical protein